MYVVIDNIFSVGDVKVRRSKDYLFINLSILKIGVATQCLKSLKCRGAKPQYWANVCLK